MMETQGAGTRSLAIRTITPNKAFLRASTGPLGLRISFKGCSVIFNPILKIQVLFATLHRNTYWKEKAAFGQKLVILRTRFTLKMLTSDFLKQLYSKWSTHRGARCLWSFKCSLEVLRPDGLHPRALRELDNITVRPLLVIFERFMVTGRVS